LSWIFDLHYLQSKATQRYVRSVHPQMNET
jgi:hypothetical protein